MTMGKAVTIVQANAGRHLDILQHVDEEERARLWSAMLTEQANKMAHVHKAHWPLNPCFTLHFVDSSRIGEFLFVDARVPETALAAMPGRKLCEVVEMEDMFETVRSAWMVPAVQSLPRGEFATEVLLLEMTR